MTEFKEQPGQALIDTVMAALSEHRRRSAHPADVIWLQIQAFHVAQAVAATFTLAERPQGRAAREGVFARIYE